MITFTRSAGIRALGAASLLLCVAVAASAHDGVVHKNEEEATRHLREGGGETAPVMKNTPGFPDIKGGDFTLVDQYGSKRSSTDPDNRFQLLFFGYAKCKAICSVALPRMAEVTERLEALGVMVTPVMITVDPARDTVEALAESAPKYHARLVALTGSEAALEEAYRAFQIEREVVFVDPEHGAVYAHGSYIYLLGPDGAFKTLFPPILGPDRIAELVQGYVEGRS